MANITKQRKFLGDKPILPLSEDLIAIQKQAWEDFIENQLPNLFKDISPIRDYTEKNWALYLEDVKLEPPKISPAYAKEKVLTYAGSVKVTARLLNKRTGKEKIEEVFLMSFPYMTNVGTFIVSGIERCVNNQLIRSPGVYFVSETDPVSRKDMFKAEIRPVHGSWLEFLLGGKGIIHARIDRRRKFPATIILKALGLEGDDRIIKELSPLIKPTLDADNTRTSHEALLEFYRRMRPGEPLVIENAQSLFNSLFFDNKTYNVGSVGRYKINKRLGLESNEEKKENWVLSRKDIVETLRYLIKLYSGEEKRLDDIDHLGNRRLRGVGEIVAQSILRRSLSRFERAVKERMSLISVKEDPKPSTMVNAQALVNSINSFFKTNQLSSILDQTNPLSELDLLRKITVTGPEGITRERATFSIRDIHSSQYGRIDPIRSPEGMNIGLVNYLALFTRVNKYGFLEAPYKKVVLEKKNGKELPKVTDEVVYLQADDEMDYYISHSGVKQDKKGHITDKTVPARYQGEFIEVPAEKIQFIDYSSQQIMGASGALIPFVSHDEANRALMGSNMQCQAVPLVKPEAPIVGTGMEAVTAQAMERVIKAKASGVVTFADSKNIIIKPDKKENIDNEDQFEVKKDNHIYKLFKYQITSPNGTSYNQTPIVTVGDRIKKGQVITNGPSIINGEMALGKNLLIAYACIEGFGYEDAVVVSDRLVKDDELTSIKINEYEAQVVDTKLGPEELTRDIPGVSETDLARLTEDGTIMIGAEVGPNDILVGKVEPKGQKELTAEERLLRAIFGEKAKEVKDTSLRVPHGEGGIVIGVRSLDREEGDELDAGVNRVVKVTVAQLRKIKEGDKIAGRHGNKGVIARVLPSHDMPYTQDGTPVDIVISPLSVISRMNLGQILEAHLGIAGKKLNENYAVPNFKEPPEEVISNLLGKAGLPVTGKMPLYDGRTGEAFDQDVTIGIAYINKLHHMVDDKIHARSTGPYSLVTQQPLGGKARMGGQRFGEMEVWALESHRAAYTLQEMLTIKSDDTEGRTRAFQAIIKGQDIPQSTLPESFRVLIRELAGLALEVSPTGVIVEDKKEVKEVNSEEKDE